MRKPLILRDLKALLIQLCRTISLDMCRKVVANEQVPFEELLRQNDDRTEYFVRQKQFSVLLYYSGCLICDIFLQNIEAKQN